MSEENKRPLPVSAGNGPGHGTEQKILPSVYNDSAKKAIVSSDTITRAAFLIGDLANFYKFHGRKQKARACYLIEDSLLQAAANMEAAHA